MAKLTIDDLKKIKEKHQATFTLREGGYRAKVTVHMGTCGIAAGARAIINTLMAEIEKSGTSDIIVTTSGCAGLCSSEPMVTIDILGHPPIKYKALNEEKMQEIFKEHILGGNIVEKYALVIGSETTY